MVKEGKRGEKKEKFSCSIRESVGGEKKVSERRALRGGGNGIRKGSARCLPCKNPGILGGGKREKDKRAAVAMCPKRKKAKGEEIYHF